MPVVPAVRAELVRAAQPAVVPADLGIPAILVEAVDLEAPVAPVGGVEALAIPAVGTVALAIHIGVTGGDTLAPRVH